MPSTLSLHEHNSLQGLRSSDFLDKLGKMPVGGLRLPLRGRMSKGLTIVGQMLLAITLSIRVCAVLIDRGWRSPN